MSQQSFVDMEYAGRKRRTRRDEFLEAMNQIIVWEEWVAVIAPYYFDGRRGRPPRGIETMLRMILLQNWFNLSDEGIEEAIYDSYAFRKFMGVDFLSGEQVPDATTLCKFRKMLHDNGITQRLFELLGAFLEKHGKIMHGGSIVDATIVDAATSTKNQSGKREPEMHQVKKGNQWYFGERLHIGVDAGSGYIHSAEVTAANGDERTVAALLVREDDAVVYADAGYCGIEKRDEIKENPHLSKIDWRVKQQKSYHRSKPWQPGPGIFWHDNFNRQQSRVRAKVEYPFLIIKRIFGYRKTRFRGLAKNRTQAWLLCASANLYMLAQSRFTGGA